MSATTTSSTRSTGISASSAFFLVLLVLKLTGVITWSWWLVTAPLWGGLVGMLLVLLILGIIAVVLK